MVGYPGQQPFSAYAYMGQQPQAGPRAQAADMRDQLAKQIMGQPAQNVSQGFGQLIAGAGMGLRDYMAQPGNQFPTAPASTGTANPATPKMQNMNFGTLFGFGPKGGLF